MLTATSNYDDALERFHRTGPEFDGFLSNHGPMVVEVLVRHGHDAAIQQWTDRYLGRLDEFPRRSWPIGPDDWREALGDVHRSADWVAFFTRQLAEQPWRSVLSTWWTRLLPGIAAGATHGVIRLGHAAAALDALQTEPRLAELAHALGYWAARWQPVAMIAPRGLQSADNLIATLPRIPDQQGGIRARLAQLDDIPTWESEVAHLRGADHSDEVPERLALIVDAVVSRYTAYAHGNPTMLVHAATAPNAVLRTLPLLPRELWTDSLTAAWSASAAVVSAYATPAAATGVLVCTPTTADDAFAAALEHGGEHVLKFTDTALCSYARTADAAALDAAHTAALLDA